MAQETLQGTDTSVQYRRTRRTTKDADAAPCGKCTVPVGRAGARATSPPRAPHFNMPTRKKRYVDDDGGLFMTSYRSQIAPFLHIEKGYKK